MSRKVRRSRRGSWETIAVDATGLGAMTDRGDANWVIWRVANRLCAKLCAVASIEDEADESIDFVDQRRSHE